MLGVFSGMTERPLTPAQKAARWLRERGVAPTRKDIRWHTDSTVFDEFMLRHPDVYAWFHDPYTMRPDEDIQRALKRLLRTQ